MSAKTFRGGIHPSYNKDRSASQPVVSLRAPAQVIIPLSQHIGAPARAVVSPGDLVLRGQLLGEAGGFVSSSVHSSISGKVLAIEPRPGGMGKDALSVVIDNDGEDRETEFTGLGAQWPEADPKKIKDMVLAAGVVGMGGATFPTHVKLSPPQDKKIDTVILNGAECEPYLTADHRIMLDRAADILTGLKITMKVLGATRGYIGVEVNKMDAMEALSKACTATGIEVVPLEIKYPQGAEKQLIDACLGRKVPSGGLPMDVGVVVQNVGTMVALKEAVVDGRPLIERVVTITGKAVGRPSNMNIRLGTPLWAALEACDADMERAGKLILGGPMMGFAQYDAQPPVIKGTSGILLLTEDEIHQRDPDPCIRCGRCLGACPMRLVPTEIALFSSKRMYAEARRADALDCVECGSCAHECPSHLPLVQQIRLAKAAIMAAQRKNA